MPEPRSPTRPTCSGTPPLWFSGAPSPIRGARAVAVALVCLALGCAGSGADRKPTATLSPDAKAEAEIRPLVGRWSRASRAERAAMAGPLDAFRLAHPNDPLSRLAEAFLAWIAMDRGDLAVAEARARLVQKTAGPGTVSDLARTVEGAALRREGKPKEALALLSPLVSKLIDGYARALLNEEVVASAVESGAWARALGLMSVWLREASLSDRATVRDRIEEHLERVPAAELARMLDAPRGIELADVAEEETEIRKIVAQRLSLVARADKDVSLAQRLVTRHGALLGDQADAVAQLASGAGRARVEPRTVGLLVSLRNDKTRRRGAEIASGIAFGLGFPATSARLVGRDDKAQPGRIADALGALAADGASVVIAGSDEEEATSAAAFAEAQRVPVLLLRPPAAGALPGGKARFSFVVGVSPEAEEDALVTALAPRAAGPLAVLVDAPARPHLPRPEVSVVRTCGDPGVPWKPLGVSGVVALAQPDCAAPVLAAAPRLRFAVGFEADGLALPPGALVATAGVFPVDPASPPASMKPWLRVHAAPPSFWAALGRDAAVLAWEGVKALPEKGTEDAGEVAARRAQAASAVAAAQTDLWTTEAKGFAGTRTLPRTVGVREVK